MFFLLYSWFMRLAVNQNHLRKFLKSTDFWASPSPPEVLIQEVWSGTDICMCNNFHVMMMQLAWGPPLENYWSRVLSFFKLVCMV